MAETAVENRVCRNCGSEVRPNSLFCYHCGKSVAPEVVQDLPRAKSNVIDGRFGGNAVEKENGFQRSGRTVVENPVEEPIPPPPFPVTSGAIEKPSADAPATVAEPELKSAAAMRRQPKSFQPKRVEIVWEEYDNAPNVWFIAAAVLIALFAAGILYFAVYLK